MTVRNVSGGRSDAAKTRTTGPRGAVSIEGISKIFRQHGGKQDGAMQALSNVTLDIKPGEFVSLIGPSGCGKTTLLRMIAGLEPVKEGQIVLDGVPVHGPGTDRAVVFQQPALLPWSTVIDNVCLGLRLQGVSRHERIEAGRQMLKLVGLDEFENRLPNELSGGMQQRVAIARALVLEPSVLLMDEPFAALDEILRRRLQRQLMDLLKQTQRTCVFVTHNVEEALLLADRVVIMSARPGRILEVFDVPLARPRAFDQEQSPEFLEARSHIWRRIEEWNVDE